MKSSHSKLQNVHYDVIQLQKYLKLKELTVDESKMLLLWRLRMTKFAANYGDKDKMCPLCSEHKDNQEDAFKCKEIRKQLVIRHKYEEIFKKPTQELVKALVIIMKIRGKRI